MRILAIDDEPLFLDILEATLDDLGYAGMTPAYSAQEALAELERGRAPYNCILLDIRMPGMDGVALCRRIRAIPGYRKTPILVLSALADREHIEEAFLAGATDFLAKPIDPLELRVRIGLAERLVAEQVRSVFLEQRAGLGGEEGEEQDPPFALETAIPLHGFDRIIGRAEFENYINSVMAREGHPAILFAVAITNAAEIYGQGTLTCFQNMLYDLAVTLEGVLKSSRTVLTYAGGGIFVAAHGEPREPDMRRVRAVVIERLQDFSPIYKRERIPLPEIAVGQILRREPGGVADAAGLLVEAIRGLACPVLPLEGRMIRRLTC